MDNSAKSHVLQFTLGDVKEFFSELGLQNLPDDRKQNMLDTAIDTILDRVLLRISPVLTEKDQLMIEDLEKKKDAPNEMLAYILSVVPNFSELVKEEVQFYKHGLKTQMANIMIEIDKEANNIPSHHNQSTTHHNEN